MIVSYSGKGTTRRAGFPSQPVINCRTSTGKTAEGMGRNATTGQSLQITKSERFEVKDLLNISEP